MNAKSQDRFTLSSSPEDEQWIKVYLQEPTSLNPEPLTRQVNIPVLYSPNSKRMYYIIHMQKHQQQTNNVQNNGSQG